MEPQNQPMTLQVQDPLLSLPIEPVNQPSLDAAVEPVMSNQPSSNEKQMPQNENLVDVDAIIDKYAEEPP